MVVATVLETACHRCKGDESDRRSCGESVQNMTIPDHERALCAYNTYNSLANVTADNLI